MYATTLAGTRHTFPDLKSVLAAATPGRSGDVLAGVSATSMEQRVAARYVLADLPLTTFLSDTVIPYESDEVTDLTPDGRGPARVAADR
jgi:ethanolamine ammonia-lyase large subunit